jgi:hypothetical protein
VAHAAASKMTETAQLDAAVQDAVTHVSTRMKTRLRHDVERIAQLEMVWRTMGSQTVLGGTLAVIVLVTLQTGLVRVASLDFKVVELGK